MKSKRIGIVTTGGDCSGLNTVIQRVITGAAQRGWTVVGIKDGTDGLGTLPTETIDFTPDTMPIETARLSGSYLCNGQPHMLNYESASAAGRIDEFNANIRKSLQDLKLDALILIGGNGSMSLAWTYRENYADVSLVCIPKTIDMDVPLTDNTIGFETAMQQVVSFCDQIIMTARSHHRYFVVQAMGRDCGNLALHAGLAFGADAILIPEIKFDMDELVEHIKKKKRDYGIILVSEGVTIRGHSGRPADIIARKLTAAGIGNRAVYPEHIQRAGDTVAGDRILAVKMADAALRAIDNNETFVMTRVHNGECETIGLADFFAAGELVDDPHVSGVKSSNAFVSPDDPLLEIAANMGIYMGQRR